MALNTWVRNEGILFAMAGGMVVLYHGYKDKNFKDVIIYALGSLALFASWQIYMRVSGIHFTANILSSSFGWDGAKFDELWGFMDEITFSTQFYGMVVYAFILISVLTVTKLIKGEHFWFFFLTVGTWLLYLALFYQIDYSWDSIKNVVNYSYKREFFCFVPLMWAYIFMNGHATNVFSRFENFLYGQKG
jgi:hypothetical protein